MRSDVWIPGHHLQISDVRVVGGDLFWRFAVGLESGRCRGRDPRLQRGGFPCRHPPASRVSGADRRTQRRRRRSVRPPCVYRRCPRQGRARARRWVLRSCCARRRMTTVVDLRRILRRRQPPLAPALARDPPPDRIHTDVKFRRQGRRTLPRQIAGTDTGPDPLATDAIGRTTARRGGQGSVHPPSVPQPGTPAGNSLPRRGKPRQIRGMARRKGRILAGKVAFVAGVAAVAGAVCRVCG